MLYEDQFIIAIIAYSFENYPSRPFHATLWKRLEFSATCFRRKNTKQTSYCTIRLIILSTIILHASFPCYALEASRVLCYLLQEKKHKTNIVLYYSTDYPFDNYPSRVLSMLRFGSVSSSALLVSRREKTKQNKTKHIGRFLHKRVTRRLGDVSGHVLFIIF